MAWYVGSGHQSNRSRGIANPPWQREPVTIYKIYKDDFFKYIDRTCRRDRRFVKDTKAVFYDYLESKKPLPVRRTTVWSTVSPMDTSVSGFHMWGLPAPGIAEHQIFLYNAYTCPSEIYVNPPRHLVLVSTSVDNVVMMVNEILSQLEGRTIEALEIFVKGKDGQGTRLKIWEKLGGHKYNVTFTDAPTYSELMDNIGDALKHAPNPFQSAMSLPARIVETKRFGEGPPEVLVSDVQEDLIAKMFPKVGKAAVAPPLKPLVNNENAVPAKRSGEDMEAGPRSVSRRTPAPPLPSRTRRSNRRRRSRRRTSRRRSTRSSSGGRGGLLFL